MNDNARLKVLVVEDEFAIRLMTSEMLNELGHDVLEAENAAVAMKAIERNAVQVLLVDVGLPDMPGSKLAGAVRDLHPDIRIIFATGNDAVAEMKTDPRLSGARLLRKPYSFDDLRKALEIF